MKQFIVSVLTVAVFFLGLGALVEQTGATFKSDEKALEIVRRARIAIGGDAAIANIQSLRIVGQTTRNITVDGIQKMETGETEIAMQMPDKVMKMIKIGKADGSGTSEKIVNKEIDVVVMGSDAKMVTVDGNTATPGKRIVIKKGDGTEQEFTGVEAEKIIAADGGANGDVVRKVIIRKPDGTVQEFTGEEADKIVVKTVPGEKATWTTESDKTINLGDEKVAMFKSGDHAVRKSNEMLRLSLGLLLSAPQGMDVSYTYGGETSVDGTTCNVVIAEFGGSSYKLFLGQSSNLPVMMTYKGSPMPQIFTFKSKKSDSAQVEGNHTFIRKGDGAEAASVEYSVRFSDYRLVGGVQMPYKWTQTIGGNADETFDVTTYEINPANIADKFKGHKVMIRTKAPEVQ